MSAQEGRLYLMMTPHALIREVDTQFPDQVFRATDEELAAAVKEHFRRSGNFPPSAYLALTLPFYRVTESFEVGQ